MTRLILLAALACGIFASVAVAQDVTVTGDGDVIGTYRDGRTLVAVDGASVKPKATPTPEPTPSPSPEPTPSPSPEPTPSPSPEPTPTATPEPPPPPDPAQEVTFPARAAFTYPWFPETWTVGGVHVAYHPTLGYYDSSDPNVVDQHVRSLDYGKVQVGIASWWGPGTHAEETRMPLLFDRTRALLSPLKWSVYYEAEGSGNPTSAEIASDLSYLQRYAARGGYAHVGGKPVVFVYNANDTTCEVADRWKAAAPDWYVVLKVFSGYLTCPNQPDAWHQYGPATGESVHRDSYVISPGYWKANEPAPQLARDPAEWRARIRRQVASAKPWQLVTTFNEWGEGTAVESAAEWASASGHGTYVDALHDDGAELPPPPPEPTPTPTPTVEPTPTATPAPADPVVLAAGDIQRPGSTSNPTEAILDSTPHDALVTLGDNQYDSGTLADYNAFYSNTWGDAADKPKNYPAPGNHEHASTLSSNYCAYFLTGNNGRAAQDPCQGNIARPFYSFNVGQWHFVSMDSGSSGGTSGDLTAEQKTFLTSDLAADNHKCEAVFWHHPRYSAGTHGPNPSLADDWSVLMDAGVDVVLNGHDHNYQRWQPMGPNGSPDPLGPREFVVGTGGGSHYTTTNRPAGLDSFNDTAFGVLSLTLHPEGYDWKFLPESGKTFTDSGTGACH